MARGGTVAVVATLLLLLPTSTWPYSPHCAASVSGERRRHEATAPRLSRSGGRADRSADDERGGGGFARLGGGGSGREKNGGGGGAFRRILLAATATPFLAHGEELPIPARRLVTDRARTIFAFCASYLADLNATQGWDADLYASGGYVRDLLLGRVSADLDLSLGLARCPPDATVAAVAGGMDGYCRGRPDLGVISVEDVSRISGGAERKGVDVAQICLVIDSDEDGGTPVFLDLLPTIGAEVYDETDRIPWRNQRGSAEMDSLRRDLTIGSMLLQVSWRQTPSGQERRKSDLRFVLLDFHGGIEDVYTRKLRCPVPRNATLCDVFGVVIKTAEDENMARSLGLDPTSSSYPDATIIQALCWAKMLDEDPYRILRTLRFSATLDFQIDPSFWLAVPFALRTGSLDAKVPSSRKIDELRKVARAGAGAPKLLNFLRTVLQPPIIGGASSAFRDSFFATPLGSVGAMNGDEALGLVVRLPPDLSVDETVGAVLTSALISCENDGGDDSACVVARLNRTLSLVDQLCDGLLAPTEIRRAARNPLIIARRLLESLPVLGIHSIFARAIPWPKPPEPISMKERARQFACMVRLWDLLHLDPRSARQDPSSDPRWVLALLAAACGGGGAPRSRAEFVAVRNLKVNTLLLMSRTGGGKDVVGPRPQGGALLGSSVAGLPEVPSHLRGQTITALNVLFRLRGDAPKIETPDDLRIYLESSCNGLLTKLTDEWWAEEMGGELRSPYSKR